MSSRSSLHCNIPQAHDRASLHSRRAEMKWIRILTELFSQDRTWSESEYELRSWRHFTKVLSLMMILGPFRRPSCIRQVSFIGVNYRRCSPGSWMHQLSGRGLEWWLSLSLSTLSSFKLFASCGLRHFRPCVIYNELVITAKSYLRVVTEASCSGV